MKCKAAVFLLVALFCVLLSGCDLEPAYPHFEYYHSNYRFDTKNTVVEVENGYELDHSHPYDVQQTECGYDIVFHMLKEG